MKLIAGEIYEIHCHCPGRSPRGNPISMACLPLQQEFLRRLRCSHDHASDVGRLVSHRRASDRGHLRLDTWRIYHRHGGRYCRAAGRRSSGPLQGRGRPRRRIDRGGLPMSWRLLNLQGIAGIVVAAGARPAPHFSEGRFSPLAKAGRPIRPALPRGTGGLCNHRRRLSLAADQARKADQANIVHVAAQQSEITERTANDFETRIALLALTLSACGERRSRSRSRCWRKPVTAPHSRKRRKHC